MFESIRADLKYASKVNLSKNAKYKLLQLLVKPGTLPVVAYRFGKWARRVRVPVVRQILVFIAIVFRFFIELVTGVVIEPGAEIGPGLVVHTWHGVYVGPAKIGCNCVVQHGVVIGWSVKEIGNNVYFGPGAKVVGTPKIGNNVVVMANSLVLTDVPDDTTVVGVPARIRLPRGATLKYRDSTPAQKSEDQNKKQSVPEPILKR